MRSELETYRATWDRKPVLRVVYEDYFRRLGAACVPGITIEIGAGSGNLKRELPAVISSDIQFAPWLDLVMDAQRLPFADRSVSNIVMLDVLHHLSRPLLFFQEARRVLRPGGRIVMIEPAITFGSHLFYRLFHDEPVIMSADPLAAGEPTRGRDPYDGNQAIPTLIATRYRQQFQNDIPGLIIAGVRWFSFAVYPLSGGFRRWSILNPVLAKIGLSAEKIIEPVLGRFMGFRLMIAIEKNKPS